MVRTLNEFYKVPSSSVGLAELSEESFIRVCQDMHKKNGGKRKLPDKTLDLYMKVVRAYESIDFEPISLRGIFYRVVSLFNNLEKTEKTYELIQRTVLDMRKKGLLDFNLIIDGTRFRSKQNSYNGLKDFAEQQSQFYRKSLWEDSPYYVEIAVEKDAMKSILWETTNYYDINLISTKGFSSLTFWYSTAETFKNIINSGKTPIFLMMTDFDEAGRNMKLSAVKTLADVFGLYDGYDYKMIDLAVTESQIKEYNLPLRPEKNKNSAINYAVEIDAFKPKEIRSILETEILKYVDVDYLNRIRDIERLERESIPSLLAG